MCRDCMLNVCCMLNGTPYVHTVRTPYTHTTHLETILARKNPVSLNPVIIYCYYSKVYVTGVAVFLHSAALSNHLCFPSHRLLTVFSPLLRTTILYISSSYASSCRTSYQIFLHVSIKLDAFLLYRLLYVLSYT